MIYEHDKSWWCFYGFEKKNIQKIKDNKKVTINGNERWWYVTISARNVPIEDYTIPQNISFVILYKNLEIQQNEPYQMELIMVHCFCLHQELWIDFENIFIIVLQNFSINLSCI